MPIPPNARAFAVQRERRRGVAQLQVARHQPRDSKIDAERPRGRAPAPQVQMEDFFGIVHQKRPQTQNGGPSGPAFADEKDFEKEMLESDFAPQLGGTLAGAADDDDEFDFDPSGAEMSADELRRLVGKEEQTTAAPAPAPELKPLGALEIGVIAEEDEEAHQEQETQEEAERVRAKTIGEENDRRMAQEWQAVERQLRDADSKTAAEADDGVFAGAAVVPERDGERKIAAKELEEYLRAKQVDWDDQDIEAYREPEDAGFSSIFCSCLALPQELDFAGSLPQRDFPFLVAKIPYDPGDPLHQDALKTIFTQLVDDPCPGISGSHWEDIGFQGADPCTDLNRSLGILSVLQCLRFVEQHRELARQIFASSETRTRQWPFMLVSINFTKRALEALRDGTLYPECNRRRAVMEVLDEVHHAIFYYFFCKLQAQSHEDQFRILNHTYAECPRGEHEETVPDGKPALPPGSLTAFSISVGCLAMLRKFASRSAEPVPDTAAEEETTTFLDIADSGAGVKPASRTLPPLDSRLKQYAA
eukprot:scaffold3229_cov246-Pinguiococcus_pyrenoidosus.AAC.2